MTQKTCSFLHYKNKDLILESAACQQLADTYGTPLYVYSKQQIGKNWQAFTQEKREDDLVCYAVKANANLSLLNILARLGAGFDIVSGGELACVLKAGACPEKIVFSGIGKREDEIEAALRAGILSFNVESLPELERIAAIAERIEMIAPITLRVNPDVDPKTHPYIATGLKHSKFGVDSLYTVDFYKKIQKNPWLKPLGLACHIGSQLTDLSPFLTAFDKLLDLFKTLLRENIHIEYLDIGGGLGVCYTDETPPIPNEYVRAIKKRAEKYPIRLIFEPGRALIANAGVLLTRVEYIKETQAQTFAILDAGMNDFLRSALYQARSTFLPACENDDKVIKPYSLVGPVCESADVFAQDVWLNLTEGALLAMTGVGAYGFSMASNYNARLRPAEVLVDGSDTRLIRARETLQTLWQLQPDFSPEAFDDSA